MQVLIGDMFYFCGMLTREEEDFVSFWEKNRDRKKKVIFQLTLGLPLSLVLVLAIFVNFFSGWYKRANMIFRADPSIFPVLLLASLLIVVFVTIFSVRHKWDINEMRYRELLARKKTGIIGHWLQRIGPFACPDLANYLKTKTNNCDSILLYADVVYPASYGRWL